MAKDIISDVFLGLWENRTSLYHVQSLKAYLYASARNRTFNHLKNNELRSVKTLDDHALNSEEASPDSFFQALLHVETIRVLREAVDTLPRECRRVIELVLKGYSTNDISRILGISASAVSHQKSRAVRLLKDKILLAVTLALPAAFSAA